MQTTSPLFDLAGPYTNTVKWSGDDWIAIACTAQIQLMVRLELICAFHCCAFELLTAQARSSQQPASAGRSAFHPLELQNRVAPYFLPLFAKFQTAPLPFRRAPTRSAGRTSP